MPLPLGEGPHHNGSARISQGLAAVRDFNPAYVSCGSEREFASTELIAKRLNLLHELVPGAKAGGGAGQPGQYGSDRTIPAIELLFMV
jgi:hypothetical protein